MSFVRKEDAAKAGKLIGAIVAVFGCAAWRVVGVVSPPKAPPAVVPAKTETLAPPVPTGETPTKAPDAEIELPSLLATANANPFKPFPKPTIAPQGRVSIPPPTPMVGTLAPLPPTSGEPTLSPHSSNVVEKPKETSFRVSGILPGLNATAVLDSGEDSTVVRQGSRLSDGSTVTHIDETSVTLNRDGKTVVLNVSN